MSSLNCPVCESGLSTTQYEGISVDWCPGCRGVWLDTDELARVVESREAKISPSILQETLALARTGVPQEDSDRRLACPRCAQAMSAINYNYSSGIIVDRCPEAHGTWLDGGELGHVQAYAEQFPESENPPVNPESRSPFHAIRRMMRALGGQ
jgi:Zn-finger nucleic acid-binding protein